jgi:hypothetical protein
MDRSWISFTRSRGSNEVGIVHKFGEVAPPPPPRRAGRPGEAQEWGVRHRAHRSRWRDNSLVDLAPTGADPNNAFNYKISMVFDADGKLVHYERDPHF